MQTVAFNFLEEHEKSELPDSSNKISKMADSS